MGRTIIFFCDVQLVVGLKNIYPLLSRSICPVLRVSYSLKLLKSCPVVNVLMICPAWAK